MPPDAEAYDAVIAGGGIQGLTLATEAAMRGLRVLLLEAGAFGGGSTAASYGIVHGGFRYWQDLDMVRLLRSRIEQAWYLRNFAGLVRPLRCVLPFYGSDRAKPKLFAIAAMMDRLGSTMAGHAAPDLPAPRLLGRAELLDLAPWLAAQPVRGAGCWHDVEIVDPPALVDAMVARARHAGATCLSGIVVQGVRQGENGRIEAVLALDTASGEPRAFPTPVMVNCAGAGLAELARAAHPQGPAFFTPLPAWNLHLTHDKPLSAAFAIGTGKRLFVRPSAQGLHAGTFYGAQDIPAALAALDAAAPGLVLARARVQCVSQGVVPEAARKLEPAHRDIILDHGRQGGPRGLFSVSGVKLTTARWLSRKVIARIWPGGQTRPAQPSSYLADAPA
ncbi:FAD-dependent oxidoreductase [Falsiroseomonas sp. E2-1-a20]|uniref:FAD-dependent oxidoreductase n=1 Tax=Falsiroseomonas sp. E2-1-a20 TaxID=3239300 RepID=UPI003F32BC5E